MKIIAINGEAFDPDLLVIAFVAAIVRAIVPAIVATIVAAQKSVQPSELLMQSQDYFLAPYIRQLVGQPGYASFGRFGAAVNRRESRCLVSIVAFATIP